MVWDRWGTLGMVRDGSEDPREGPGRGRGPSGRSGTGLRTLGAVRDRSGHTQKVRDGSGYSPEGTGWVWGLLGRSETGLGTLGEVQDGLGDPRGGPGRI